MSFRDRIRRAWETGLVSPEGWEAGYRDPEDLYLGEGSQAPPAKDRDGVQVEVEGVFTPEDVERVASKYMARTGRSWTPEQRLLSALNSGDKLRDQISWLLRENPNLRPYLTKAMHHTEVALQILGRDVTRELHLPSVKYGSLGRPKSAPMTRTAGEVRFIKDRSGDEKQWGWPPMGPSEREIGSDYQFNPTKLKPLSQSLRASLMALGHAMSGYQTFAKIKSATISPDGNLGGRGYIQKIAEIRRQYMNIIEALSAVTDTFYDEINAPHWNPSLEDQSPRERQEVREIMDDVEEIKKDPEEFAKGEEAEMDAEGGKQASRSKRASMDRRAGGFGGVDRWFDAEVNKLLDKEYAATSRRLRAEITKLVTQAGRRGGWPVKDAADAADRVLENLLPEGGPHWGGWAANNFWNNSFYWFDLESGARVAAKEQHPEWVSDISQFRIRRVAEAYIAKKQRGNA